jgi:hypothetical protein
LHNKRRPVAIAGWRFLFVNMAKFLALFLVCFAAVGQTLSVINTGTTSNDGTGDSLRSAFTKANTNFYQLWSEVFTNIPVDIANAGGAGKLNTTNGTAVNLTGSLTNVSVKGTLTYDLSDESRLSANLDYGIGLDVGLSSTTAKARIRSVSTIADLLTVDPLTSDIFSYVKVLGYSSAGDGGGGDFRRVLSSGGSTNLGTFFKSTANATYAWQRVIDNAVISARWFGAKGDRSTDDTSAIQAAMDYFGSAGGTLQFPAGDYRITSAVTVKPKVNVVGPGGFYTEDQTSAAKMFAPGTATIYTDNTTGQFALFTVAGTNSAALGYEPSLETTLSDGSNATNYPAFLEISGIGFAAVGASTTNSVFTNNITGIYLDRVTQVRITDCGFIYLTGYPIRTWACNNITIRDNQFGSLGGRGIFLDQTADSSVSGNFAGGTIGPVLWLRGNKDAFINNFLFNNQTPSYFDASFASVDTAADTITITNNRSPVNHYLRLGDPITFRANGGTLPSPLAENTIYYAIPTSASTFKVNTQYDQGISGGALQSVGINLTTAGSGTPVAELHGPVRAVAVHGVNESLWVGNRIDQAWEAGMDVVNSTGVSITGNQIQESGLNNTNYTGAQLLFVGSTNNVITGNRFAKRASSRYGLGGVGFDSSSSRNIVGANSFDSGITTNYAFSGKVGGSLSFNQDALTLKPNSGNAALSAVTEINGNAATFYNYNSTMPGPRWRFYAAQGSESSPSAVAAFAPIFELSGAAYNGSGYNEGYGRLRLLTYATQTPSEAGTYWVLSTASGTTSYNSIQIDPATTSTDSALSIYVNGSLQRLKRDTVNNLLYLGSTAPTSPQFTAIELGHASDTTLARSAAGKLTVEGNLVPSPTSPTTGQIIVYTNSAWAAMTPGASGIGGSTGSTDNSLLRADGTGGATAQNSAVIIDDFTSSTANNVAIKVDDGSTANIAAVITPKGTGAFIVGPKPDGTATGGNARGGRAVDLQVDRLLATDVASGNSSVVLGGYRNSATLDYTVAGGALATASGIYGSIALGYVVTSSGGYGSFATGTSTTASGRTSMAGGESAVANKRGQFAVASGQFGAAGDSQTFLITARNATSSTTQTTLFINGSSEYLTIPNNTTWTFTALLTGTTASGAATYSYKFEGVIVNAAGTTSMPVAVTKTVIYESDAAADADAVANNTNDSLDFKVTAANSTATRWSVSVTANQVSY